MRIALANSLISPFGVGGAGRSVAELASALGRAGHDVHLISLAPEDFQEPSVSASGVTNHRFRNNVAFRPFAKDRNPMGAAGKFAWHAAELNRRSAYNYLLERFKQIEPDIVHTNNIAGFGLAAWSASLNWPLVHTVRDYYLACVRSNMYKGGATCTGRCLPCKGLKPNLGGRRRVPDIWVGVSEEVLRVHSEAGIIPSGAQSAVVYNRPQIGHVKSRDGLDGGCDEVVFGLLGRISEDKGTWLAIDAFLKIGQRRGTGARLIVAGPGSPEDVRRISELALVDTRLEYLGVVTPESFYERIDITLVPSQWAEPFGRVVAEARMANTRVIASKVGGIPEAMSLFGGGRLVEDFSNPDAWADAMNSELENGRRMPDVAREVFIELPEVRYLDLYSSAISRHRSARD